MTLPVILLLLIEVVATAGLVAPAFASGGPSIDSKGGVSHRCSSASICSPKSKTYNANDVLVACVTLLNSGDLGISSSPVLGWSQIGPNESVSGSVQVECWWATTPSTQAIVVTGTTSVSGNMVVLVQGFQGINSTSPIDGSGCGAVGTSSPSSCSISTFASNDIIVSVIAISGSSTLTPTVSFTEAFADSGSPVTNMEYLAVTSSQTGLSLSMGYTKSRYYAQLGFALTASLPVFNGVINLSNDNFNSSFSDQHDLVATGSNVYVTWDENTGVGKTPQVMFTASNDNGTSFGPVINISSDAGPATLPKVAAEGSHVYVVWRDQSSGVPLVYIRSSSDYGGSFGPTKQLSNLSSIEPKAAACGGGVFVAWVNSTSRAQAQKTAAKYTMFFRASQDGGTTWGPIINLQSDDTVVANGNEEEVECSGSNVYVAYSDWSPGIRSVFLRASHDLGQTFDPHVAIFVPTTGNIREPVVVVGGSYVYAYWIYRSCTHCNYQSFVRSSSDNGVTWGSSTNLCSDSYDCHEPFMTATGADVYVVIHEFVSTSTTKLYFRASHDGGVTWSPKLDLIPNGTKKSSYGSIAAVGNWVYVGFSNKTKAGNWEMFLMTSSDKGATFSPAYDLSNNKGASGVFIFGHQEREIAASNNHVYAAWEDNDTPTKSINIFFESVQVAP
jgi:hypothetical protein